MYRNRASSPEQAIEWIKRWKAESRTILFTYVSTTMECAFVQFKGRIRDVMPLEFGSIAVQVAGSEGFATVQLTGSVVDPSLASVPAGGRQIIVEFTNKPPFPILEAVELVLASGSLLFVWREDLQARKPSRVH